MANLKRANGFVRIEAIVDGNGSAQDPFETEAQWVNVSYIARVLSVKDSGDPNAVSAKSAIRIIDERTLSSAGAASDVTLEIRTLHTPEQILGIDT